MGPSNGGGGGVVFEPGDGGDGLGEGGIGEHGDNPPAYSCNHQLAIQNLLTFFRGRKVISGDSNAVVIINVRGNAVFDSMTVVLTGGIKPENVIWNVFGTLTINEECTVQGVILAQNAKIVNRLALVDIITIATYSKLEVIDQYPKRNSSSFSSICGFQSDSSSGSITSSKPAETIREKIYRTPDCTDLINKSPDVASHFPTKTIMVVLHIFKPASSNLDIPEMFRNFSELDIPYLKSMVEGYETHGGVAFDENGQPRTLQVPLDPNPNPLKGEYRAGGPHNYPPAFLSLAESMRELKTPTIPYGALNGFHRKNMSIKFKIANNGIKFYRGSSYQGTELDNVMNSYVQGEEYKNTLSRHMGKITDYLSLNSEPLDQSVIHIYLAESYTPNDIDLVTGISSAFPCTGNQIKTGGLSDFKYEGTNIATGLNHNVCLIQSRNFLNKYHSLQGLYKYSLRSVPPCTYKEPQDRLPDHHQMNVTAWVIMHEIAHCIGLDHIEAPTSEVCTSSNYDGLYLNSPRVNNLMVTMLPDGGYFHLTHCQKGRIHEKLETDVASKWVKEDFCGDVVNTSGTDKTFVDGAVVVPGNTNPIRWYSRMQMAGDLIVQNNSILEVGCKLTFPRTVNQKNCQIGVFSGATLRFKNGSSIGNAAKPGCTLVNSTVEIGSSTISPAGIETINNADGLVVVEGDLTLTEDFTLRIRKNASLLIKSSARIIFKKGGNFIVDDGAYICFEEVNGLKGTIVMADGTIQVHPNANLGRLNPAIPNPPSNCANITACTMQQFGRAVWSVSGTGTQRQYPATGYTITLCPNTQASLTLADPSGVPLNAAEFMWYENGTLITSNGGVVTPVVPANTTKLYEAKITKGGCSYAYAIKVTTVQPSLVLETPTTCTSQRVRLSLNAAGYAAFPNITWTPDAGFTDVTPNSANLCGTACNTLIKEYAYSTSGTYDISVTLVNPVSGCTTTLTQQVVVSDPDANGQCCEISYARTLGTPNQVTILNLDGETVTYRGNTKVEGAVVVENGTIIFPVGSLIEFGYNDKNVVNLS